ncbi:uncharacterized protein EDB91DRAFT_1243543 [Suillus paluster]|uniref:uncharacterized protein n=1 Tax=Suillus paluster TaxID=48578 RepID=UPI001B871117|nr:uncharacterized protein EDB91DRAFT_1243543 [Suillus paluster]KAG1751273.1 hypothetical protein EDB91DRAFT_1243543 [Suillus paluster]
MRTFILIATLATATVHTVHAMPSSSLTIRSTFDDTPDFTHASHPSHYRTKLYQGKKLIGGERRMVLDQAAPGSIHLAEPGEEQEAPIIRRRKMNKRGVLRERTIKNADYGSGSAPAGEAAASAHTQAEPTPNATTTPAAAPGPETPDDAGPAPAAHA